LESLCKIYGSAEYLEKAMRDWSDDVFFLDLWTELQYRASNRTQVAGTLTVADVASRTSTTIGTEEADASGALFDETASSYQKLRIRCEGYITDLVSANVRTTLTAYTRINPWATLQSSQSHQGHTLPPTAELDSLLSMLSSHLSFLSKALGKIPLRRLARSATTVIDQILFDAVLLRHSFSAAGALQFSADITAVRSIVNKFVGGGVAEVGLARVGEGSALVGLKIRAASDENEDESEGEGGDGEARGSGKRVLGLWEAEKGLFGDGEQARLCLEALGFERLTVAEARKVLARRVELGS